MDLIVIIIQGYIHQIVVILAEVLSSPSFTTLYTLSLYKRWQSKDQLHMNPYVDVYSLAENVVYHTLLSLDVIRFTRGETAKIDHMLLNLDVILTRDNPENVYHVIF